MIGFGKKKTICKGALEHLWTIYGYKASNIIKYPSGKKKNIDIFQCNASDYISTKQLAQRISEIYISSSSDLNQNWSCFPWCSGKPFTGILHMTNKPVERISVKSM